MERFKGLIKRTRSTAPHGGFIHSLQREQIAEKQRVAAKKQLEAREAEKTRQMQIDAFREQQAREAQAYKQQMEEALRQARLNEKRSKALKKSPVPKLLKELGKAIDKPVSTWGNNVGLYIILSNYPPENPNNEPPIDVARTDRFAYDKHIYKGPEEITTSYAINAGIFVQGVEDGSVRIGDTLLSKDEMLDPRIIDLAIQTAYLNPKPLRTTHFLHKIAHREWKEPDPGDLFDA